MTNEQLSQSSGSPQNELNTSISSKPYSENPSSPKLNISQDLSPASSTSVSPIPVDNIKLKRQREDSCERDENRNSPNPPPCKTAKMGYSIMNLLAKDKKETKTSVANKENNLDSHPVSPAPVNTDSNPTVNQNPMNQFFLNPFLAAAAAAASNQNGQSNLLNNISNLAMLSKGQSPEMWPWFNMAAMSALYGLDSKFSFFLLLLLFQSNLSSLIAQKKFETN